jgi:hypothetical protein
MPLARIHRPPRLLATISDSMRSHQGSSQQDPSCVCWRRAQADCTNTLANRNTPIRSTGYDIRGGLGSLQESLQADLALNVHGLLILYPKISINITHLETRSQSARTVLVCDLATLLLSALLRSRFWLALAPC